MSSERGKSERALIRVLQLTSTSDMGGAEQMALWLGRSLDPARFSTAVASLVGSGALIERASEEGFPARHLHFRWPFDFAGIIRLIRFVREQRIDVVQTHGLRADMVGRWAVRLGGARAVVSTIHSVDPWRRRWHSLLDRATAPFVSRFVAVCQAAKDAVVAREHIDPARINVVYNGIAPLDVPHEQRDVIRAELGLTSDAFPVIGMLANLWPLKGHHEAIRALAVLRDAFPHATLLLAGRDESGGALQAFAADLGLSRQVQFLGFRRDTP